MVECISKMPKIRVLVINNFKIVFTVSNGNSPRLWLDAYHTPLIPIAPGFSWQCDMGRWRSLEPCFALCVKISYHLSYATIWFPLHYQVYYLHSHYFCHTFLLFYCTTMWSTGSSCGQGIQNVIRCHDNWLIVSRIAWIPNIHCISV